MGFMAITTDVNVTLLNECFELRPFHGLCKPHSGDITHRESSDNANQQTDDDDVRISGVHTSKLAQDKRDSTNSPVLMDDGTFEHVPEVKHKLSEGDLMNK